TACAHWRPGPPTPAAGRVAGGRTARPSETRDCWCRAPARHLPEVVDLGVGHPLERLGLGAELVLRHALRFQRPDPLVQARSSSSPRALARGSSRWARCCARWDRTRRRGGYPPRPPPEHGLAAQVGVPAAG